MNARRSPRFSRRRFLSVLAGAAAPLAACRPSGASAKEYFWSGIGFGIDMSMEIHGVTDAEGERLGKQCEEIIRELEQAFSLYLEDSELSILNRERKLLRPSALFRGLIGTATDLSTRTLGYYQPAIHGAWSWLMGRDGIDDPDGNPAWIEQCAACDMKFLESAGDGSFRLSHPLTQLSMNAIVQGFLADLVAERVRAAGVASALLHLGESYAIGRHPDGRLWKLAVTGTPGDGEADVIGYLEFADAGLAVSAQDSTRMLIDPVAATVRRQSRVAAIVSTAGATVADVYATAFAVAAEERWAELADSLRGSGSQVRLWIENKLQFEA